MSYLDPHPRNDISRPIAQQRQGRSASPWGAVLNSPWYSLHGIEGSPPAHPSVIRTPYRTFDRITFKPILRPDPSKSVPEELTSSLVEALQLVPQDGTPLNGWRKGLMFQDIDIPPFPRSRFIDVVRFDVLPTPRLERRPWPSPEGSSIWLARAISVRRKRSSSPHGYWHRGSC
jgi:hypothetical protein